MPGKASGSVPSQETSPPSLSTITLEGGRGSRSAPWRGRAVLLPVRRRRGQVRRAATLLAAAICVPSAELCAQVTANVHVTVRAALAAPVAGRVDVAATTIPVEGAAVTVRGTGLTALTDPGGSVLLRGLSPGRHALTISALGFAEATVEVEAVNGRLTRASVVLDPAPVRLPGLDVRVASREGVGRATIVDPASLPPGVADLAAALDRVPGATVVRRGGPGAPAVVQLRGSGGDQVLVLLDGAPVNSPLTGEADLGMVDLEGLARIVVIPGAQSARTVPGPSEASCCWRAAALVPQPPRSLPQRAPGPRPKPRQRGRGHWGAPGRWPGPRAGGIPAVPSPTTCPPSAAAARQRARTPPSRRPGATCASRGGAA